MIKTANKTLKKPLKNSKSTKTKGASYFSVHTYRGGLAPQILVGFFFEEPPKK
jgi:hypothetical protein